MLSIILFDVVLITEISLASRTFGGEAVISKHSLAPSTSHYCMIPYQYLEKKSNLSLKNSSINNEINYSKHFYLVFFFLKKNVIILLIKVLERLNQIFILSSGE